MLHQSVLECRAGDGRGGEGRAEMCIGEGNDERWMGEGRDDGQYENMHRLYGMIYRRLMSLLPGCF